MQGKSFGYIVGQILSAIIAACLTACIGGGLIALTLKFLTWIFQLI